MANENRLIDAEKFKRVLQNMIRHLMEFEEDKMAEIMVTMIESTIKCLNLQPTVDAVEVVHGRWEKAEYHGFLRCSECKDAHIDDTWVADVKWNYCPNCGAKMYGDGND